MKKAIKTNRELATLYKCHPRTIPLWRKEGAPLSSHKAMRRWLSTRKNIPPRLSTDGQAVAPAVTAAVADTAEWLGAGGALDRIARAEADAHARMIKALDGGDPLFVKQARENWLRLCDRLRAFERSVSEDKRAKGVLVLKSEVEAALRFLGICLRQGVNSALPTMSMQLVNESDVHRIRTIILRIWHANEAIAFGRLFTNISIPEWITDAVSNDLQTEVCTPKAEMLQLGRLLDEAMQDIVAKVVEGVPHVPPAPAEQEESKV